jgi:hypothetical protein
MSSNKKVEPMDPSFQEDRTPVVKANQQRVCHAIKTLTEEVWALFPETPVTYDNYNGRNTALTVVFDLSSLPEDRDRVDLIVLLELIESDERVQSVLVEDGTVAVTMRANPRTQDSREPFGVALALDILADDSEGFEVHSEGYSVIEGSS